MTRKTLISGNWKMNLNHFEAIQTVQKLSYLVPKETLEVVDVSVHPPGTVSVTEYDPGTTSTPADSPLPNVAVTSPSKSNVWVDVTGSVIFETEICPRWVLPQELLFFVHSSPQT